MYLPKPGSDIQDLLPEVHRLGELRPVWAYKPACHVLICNKDQNYNFLLESRGQSRPLQSLKDQGTLALLIKVGVL